MNPRFHAACYLAVALSIFARLPNSAIDDVLAPGASPSPAANLEFLRELTVSVLESSKVPAGGRLSTGAPNTTGYSLRVPGGTQSYYPAFWIRDAAMMLGGGFVTPDEIEGWVRIIAATQPGEEGLHFGKLAVPPFSIPDHVTLSGEACWYPGAFTDQGNGAFGFLPPADDAFYFIDMVYAHMRLTGNGHLWRASGTTKWGKPLFKDICVRAFDSVATDPSNGLIVCADSKDETRVDWGFCDTIRKSGLCLMPSLLRWRAAQELAELFTADGDSSNASRFAAEAHRIKEAIPEVFLREVATSNKDKEYLLLSATQLGRKDDVWASAFAVWLGVLPPEIAQGIARHLLSLWKAGGTIFGGQIRHIPPEGPNGGFWEVASCDRDTYQNGGFWATPTGWFVCALAKVEPSAADRLLDEYVTFLRTNRAQGAPWEWVGRSDDRRVNPRYGSSAGCVYLSILAGRN